MYGAKTGWMLVAIAIVGLTVSPAISAGYSSLPSVKQRRAAAMPRAGIGSFTPAAADPRLAAAFARSGLTDTGFRFTPATGKSKPQGIVKVAVRARSSVAASFKNSARPAAQALVAVQPDVAIAPVAYNLGVAVGWKRFALSGDVARSDPNGPTGGRDGAALGLSYNANKWSTRVQVEAARPTGSAPRALTGGETIALDVGGSYSIARNIDLTAGVRYKTERDRLRPIEDNRRDSQAVYIGTAFKF